MNAENGKLELPSWLDVIAVFDTETTGIDVKQSKIVTAALHLLNSNGEVLPGGRDWLLNPGVPIPPAATAVHKITDEIAQRDGMDATQGVQEIVSAIQELFDKGIPIVAYNASYDFSLLHNQALSLGIQPVKFGTVIDPLIIDKTVDKWRKGSRKLVDVAQHYNVSLENAHTAKDDAVAAGLVAYSVLRFFKAQSKPVVPVPDSSEQLHEMQSKWADEIEASFAKWRQQDMPSYVPSFGWPIKQG